MPDTLSIRGPDTPILIADDSFQFAQVLNKILVGVFQYRNITIVPSADEAFTRISAVPGQYRLMFFDFHFPVGINGGELLVKLNENGLLTGKQAFLMSSDPTADGVQQARLSGAVGVITKPFDRDELRRQLDTAEKLASGDSGFSF